MSKVEIVLDDIYYDLEHQLKIIICREKSNFINQQFNPTREVSLQFQHLQRKYIDDSKKTYLQFQHDKNAPDEYDTFLCDVYQLIDRKMNDFSHWLSCQNTVVYTDFVLRKNEHSDDEKFFCCNAYDPSKNREKEDSINIYDYAEHIEKIMDDAMNDFNPTTTHIFTPSLCDNFASQQELQLKIQCLEEEMSFLFPQECPDDHCHLVESKSMKRMNSENTGYSDTTQNISCNETRNDRNHSKYVCKSNFTPNFNIPTLHNCSDISSGYRLSLHMNLSTTDFVQKHAKYKYFFIRKHVKYKNQFVHKYVKYKERKLCLHLCNNQKTSFDVMLRREYQNKSILPSNNFHPHFIISVLQQTFMKILAENIYPATTNKINGIEGQDESFIESAKTVFNGWIICILIVSIHGELAPTLDYSSSMRMHAGNDYKQYEIGYDDISSYYDNSFVPNIKTIFEKCANGPGQKNIFISIFWQRTEQNVCTMIFRTSSIANQLHTVPFEYATIRFRLQISRNMRKSLSFGDADIRSSRLQFHAKVLILQHVLLLLLAIYIKYTNNIFFRQMHIGNNLTNILWEPIDQLKRDLNRLNTPDNDPTIATEIDEQCNMLVMHSHFQHRKAIGLFMLIMHIFICMALMVRNVVEKENDLLNEPKMKRSPSSPSTLETATSSLQKTKEVVIIRELVYFASKLMFLMAMVLSQGFSNAIFFLFHNIYKYCRVYSNVSKSDVIKLLLCGNSHDPILITSISIVWHNQERIVYIDPAAENRNNLIYIVNADTILVSRISNVCLVIFGEDINQGEQVRAIKGLAFYSSHNAYIVRRFVLDNNQILINLQIWNRSHFVKVVIRGVPSKTKSLVNSHYFNTRLLLLQFHSKAFLKTEILPFEKYNCESKCASTSTSTSLWLYCDRTQSGGFIIWGNRHNGKDFFRLSFSTQIIFTSNTDGTIDYVIVLHEDELQVIMKFILSYNHRKHILCKENNFAVLIEHNDCAVEVALSSRNLIIQGNTDEFQNSKHMQVVLHSHIVGETICRNELLNMGESERINTFPQQSLYSGKVKCVLDFRNSICCHNHRSIATAGIFNVTRSHNMKNQFFDYRVYRSYQPASNLTAHNLVSDTKSAHGYHQTSNDRIEENVWYHESISNTNADEFSNNTNGINFQYFESGETALVKHRAIDICFHSCAFHSSYNAYIINRLFADNTQVHNTQFLDNKAHFDDVNLRGTTSETKRLVNSPELVNESCIHEVGFTSPIRLKIQITDLSVILEILKLTDAISIHQIPQNKNSIHDVYKKSHPLISDVNRLKPGYGGGGKTNLNRIDYYFVNYHGNVSSTIYQNVKVLTSWHTRQSDVLIPLCIYIWDSSTHFKHYSELYQLFTLLLPEDSFKADILKCFQPICHKFVLQHWKGVKICNGYISQSDIELVATQRLYDGLFVDGNMELSADYWYHSNSNTDAEDAFVSVDGPGMNNLTALRAHNKKHMSARADQNINTMCLCKNLNKNYKLKLYRCLQHGASFFIHNHILIYDCCPTISFNKRNQVNDEKIKLLAARCLDYATMVVLNDLVQFGLMHSVSKIVESLNSLDHLYTYVANALANFDMFIAKLSVKKHLEICGENLVYNGNIQSNKKYWMNYLCGILDIVVSSHNPFLTRSLRMNIEVLILMQVLTEIVCEQCNKISVGTYLDILQFSIPSFDQSSKHEIGGGCYNNNICPNLTCDMVGILDGIFHTISQ